MSENKRGGIRWIFALTAVMAQLSKGYRSAPGGLHIGQCKCGACSSCGRRTEAARSKRDRRRQRNLGAA